jgi:hypothetical protein
MQITGKILNIVSDGGYPGSHGYIFTYQITLDDGSPDGITGQIGSKKDTYPKNIGDELTVTSTTNQHGTSFKTVFAQNNNGGGGGQQQNQQQPQQQQSQQGGGYTPPPQNPPRDFDKEARGKCACLFIAAAIQSGQVPCKTESDCNGWVDYVMAVGGSDPK